MYELDVRLGKLPDLLTFADGTPVRTAADWPRRLAEIFAPAVELEYGGMPPAPEFLTVEHIHTPGAGRLNSYRIITGTRAKPFAFVLQLYLPKEMEANAEYPVVLTGDGCYRYCSDAVIDEINRRGMIAAKFNRTELAADIWQPDTVSGIYDTYPGMAFSAISAWAWGYHRVVDALLTLPFVDKKQIAITGHSRGGKAVLLAGACDERIAYVAPNGSGTHGCGCYRYEHHEDPAFADVYDDLACERLEFLVRAVPAWLGPRMKEYVGRENQLPHDMHFFKAACAPRCLIETEGLADIWANPRGSCVSTQAAKPVYDLLGCGENIVLHYRPGGHDHSLADFCVLLDCMDAKRSGSAMPVYENPFPGLA